MLVGYYWFRVLPGNSLLPIPAYQKEGNVNQITLDKAES